VTAPVSPQRATYEAFQDAFPTESWGPWELLSGEDREGWKPVAKAAAEASPELADARTQIGRLQAMLAEVTRERDLLVRDLRSGEAEVILSGGERRSVTVDSAG
jgi:hypothetical protein